MDNYGLKKNKVLFFYL